MCTETSSLPVYKKMNADTLPGALLDNDPKHTADTKGLSLGESRTLYVEWVKSLKWNLTEVIKLSKQTELEWLQYRLGQALQSRCFVQVVKLMDQSYHS